MDLKRRRKLLAKYRIDTGKGFHLKDHDPGDTAGLDLNKDAGAALLSESTDRLSTLQDKLYAQDRWGVLCIFQAMDAAGKDSVIKHVMDGVNPQGVQVVSFKQPSSEELGHDFLWRISRALPERGRIGIFNRSHYEEVVALKVHPEWLEPQRLPLGERDDALASDI